MRTLVRRGSRVGAIVFLPSMLQHCMGPVAGEGGKLMNALQPCEGAWPLSVGQSGQRPAA